MAEETVTKTIALTLTVPAAAQEASLLAVLPAALSVDGVAARAVTMHLHLYLETWQERGRG